MILNPVIQGGGTEKEYKITNTSQIRFPTSAKAGEFVRSLDAYGGIDPPRVYIRGYPSVPLGKIFDARLNTKATRAPSRAFLFCYACIRCYRRVTSRNEVAA